MEKKFLEFATKLVGLDLFRSIGRHKEACLEVFAVRFVGE